MACYEKRRIDNRSKLDPGRKPRAFGDFLLSSSFFRSRELRSLQSQMNRYQATHAAVNLLVNETIEYSKRNPDINPILEAIGVKNKTAPAAAIKPATK